MYGHDFYLTPEEQAKHEGTNEKDRTYVLPSARTISEHKQFLVTETETDAGLALLDKDISVKAFKEDWPSIKIIEGHRWRRVSSSPFVLRLRR